MYAKRVGLGLLLAAMLLRLAGCAAGPAAAPMLHISLAASADINPDARGRPSPVLVRIYELAAAGDFQDAGFFKLYDDDKEVLGGDLVTRSALIMLPGQKQEITQALDPRTSVVAAVVAYRDIDHAEWRVLCPVPERDGAAVSISIDLGAAAVRIANGSRAPR
jgi:type VI secretion system protein VasD